MLENTEGVIKKGKSRETGHIGCTRRRQTKKKTQHNMCWTLLCASRRILRKQDMHPTTKSWRQRRTEHHFLFFCRNRNGYDNNVATCK